MIKPEIKPNIFFFKDAGNARIAKMKKAVGSMASQPFIRLME
jgi:hypothetical protein